MSADPSRSTGPNPPTDLNNPAGHDHPTESGLAPEQALELAWERALELACESFCGNTTPVGAVVTDAAGAIVAEGRGRRFETAAPPGQLAWTGVAAARSR